MGVQSRTADDVVGQIATKQHGVVTRAQLLNAGVSTKEVECRLQKGTLLPVYRGVYRVGHRAPSIEARYMAAVHACGNRAVLSGRAAAFVYGLVRGQPPPPEVTSPTQRRVDGAKTHHCRDLDARDTTTWRGIPITTVPRTLVDLAASLTAEELARACHEAGFRHDTTPRQVEEVLARRPNSPGAAKLRRVLLGDVRVTLSKLERRFLELLREAGLPLPETNRPAGGRRVDCRWPDQRVTVELDSYRYHSPRHAWERDRRREREAYARGDEFRRYTYGDVFEGGSRLMMSELRALLTRRYRQPARRGDRVA
jgi:predicted transcriptional regulator of viral defense system